MNQKKTIRIGTRASKLAMLQTESIITLLKRQWPALDVQIEQIHTLGDRNTTMPLTAIGGDGVFVAEIERALLEGRIDLAVHSLKDLPTVQPAGLHACVVGEREDARDVLVWNEEYTGLGESMGLGQGGDKPYRDRLLPDTDPLACHSERSEESHSPQRFFAALRMTGSGTGRSKTPALEGVACPRSGSTQKLRIGTCSLRRTAQLRAWQPGVDILPLRGNVDTRLRKLDAGEYDAIVLAAAGLHRLGAHERVAQRLGYLPFDVMLPAPGQGALALELRDEAAMRELVAPLRNTAVEAATTAERMFMRRLGAGCYLPIAAYGEIREGRFSVEGLVISLDGEEQVRVESSIPWTTQETMADAVQMGEELAELALAEGADAIIATVNEGRVREHASFD